MHQSRLPGVALVFSFRSYIPYLLRDGFRRRLFANEDAQGADLFPTEATPSNRPFTDRLVHRPLQSIRP